MKPIISIITGISLISLIGCNNADRNQNLSDDEAGITKADIADTPPPSLETSEMRPTSSVNPDEENQNEEDDNYTETEEVVQVDTVGMTVKYDVNRRIIEQVDTVGATTTYEVERKIIKRRVRIDTVTETASKEEQVAYEEGNYQMLNEEIEKDTITKTINNPTPEELRKLKELESKTAEKKNPETEALKETQKTSSQPNNPKITPAQEEAETQTSQTDASNASEVANEANQTADSVQRKTPSYQPVQQDTVAADTTQQNSN